jgi:hypothetical protein
VGRGHKTLGRISPNPVDRPVMVGRWDGGTVGWWDGEKFVAVIQRIPINPNGGQSRRNILGLRGYASMHIIPQRMRLYYDAPVYRPQRGYPC